MPHLRPTVWLRRITQITPRWLERYGIRALFLDVDNTLTTHNNPVPAERVWEWLACMRENGIRLEIISNNRPERVAPFAHMLGLGFTANAAKPLTGGFRRAAKKLGVKPRETAVVGDQIFTDILGANRFGAYSVLVDPMEPEALWFFRIKRRLEKPVLAKIKRREDML